MEEGRGRRGCGHWGGSQGKAEPASEAARPDDTRTATRQATVAWHYGNPCKDLSAGGAARSAARAQYGGCVALPVCVRPAAEQAAPALAGARTPSAADERRAGRPNCPPLPARAISLTPRRPRDSLLPTGVMVRVRRRMVWFAQRAKRAQRDGACGATALKLQCMQKWRDTTGCAAAPRTLTLCVLCANPIFANLQRVRHRSNPGPACRTPRALRPPGPWSRGSSWRCSRSPAVAPDR